jgi:hypothetical protein
MSNRILFRRKKITMQSFTRWPLDISGVDLNRLPSSAGYRLISLG